MFIWIVLTEANKDLKNCKSSQKHDSTGEKIEQSRFAVTRVH